MTKADMKVTLSALDTEIAAFRKSLRDRKPHRDHWGTRQFDVREDYLGRLEAARRALVSLKVAQ